MPSQWGCLRVLKVTTDLECIRIFHPFPILTSTAFTYLGWICPICIFQTWLSPKTFTRPCGRWIIFPPAKYFYPLANLFFNLAIFKTEHTSYNPYFHQSSPSKLGPIVPRTWNRYLHIYFVCLFVRKEFHTVKLLFCGTYTGNNMSPITTF